MKAKRYAYAALLLPLVMTLVLATGGARAQGPDDAERVRYALEATDEVIMKAREAVQESRSQKGRVKLEEAEALQKKAWEYYGLATKRDMSMKLTLQAREEAYSAIGFARLETQTEERMGRYVEETKERMAKVREMIMEGEIRAERSMKLLDEARNLLEKSRLNAQQLRYQLAMKLAEGARQRVIQAEQEVRRLRTLKEMTERRLALMERLVERTRERVRDARNERAGRQLRIAEEQLSKTRQLLGDGRYRASRLMIEKCEKTFRSLIRQLPAGVHADPERMLHEAYRLLERAEEMIAAEGEPAAIRTRMELLERARSMLGLAEEDIARDQAEQAGPRIREARRIIRRATMAESREMTRERAAETIRRTENLRDSALQAAEFCSAPGVRSLFSRASDHLEKAKAYIEEGRMANASAEAMIARNLYNRIREICAS